MTFVLQRYFITGGKTPERFVLPLRSKALGGYTHNSDKGFYHNRLSGNSLGADYSLHKKQHIRRRAYPDYGGKLFNGGGDLPLHTCAFDVDCNFQNKQKKSYFCGK